MFRKDDPAKTSGENKALRLQLNHLSDELVKANQEIVRLTTALVGAGRRSRRGGRGRGCWVGGPSRPRRVCAQRARCISRAVLQLPGLAWVL